MGLVVLVIKRMLNRSETSHKHSDACMESAHSNDRASPNKGDVTTRSGRVVKSTQDNENFLYYNY